MNIKFNRAIEPFKQMEQNGKITIPAPLLFGLPDQTATNLVRVWDNFLLGPQLPASEVDFPALEVFW